MRIRQRYYGWLKDGAFFLSLSPADAPVRPSLRLETMEEVLAFLKRRRGEVLWWPPLPDQVHAEYQSEFSNAPKPDRNSRLERWS